MKWLSYAPNMLSTWIAQDYGADDALLLSRPRHHSGPLASSVSRPRILEGPTFGIAWLRRDGVWETPDPSKMGILQSVTQRIACDLADGMARSGSAPWSGVRWGQYSWPHFLEHATCVVAMSSGRDLVPVRSILLPADDSVDPAVAGEAQLELDQFLIPADNNPNSSDERRSRRQWTVSQQIEPRPHLRLEWEPSLVPSVWREAYLAHAEAHEPAARDVLDGSA